MNLETAALRWAEHKVNDLHDHHRTDDEHMLLFKVQQILNAAVLSMWSASHQLDQAGSGAADQGGNDRGIDDLADLVEERSSQLTGFLRLLGIAVDELEQQRPGQPFRPLTDLGESAGPHLGQRLVQFAEQQQEVLGSLLAQAKAADLLAHSDREVGEGAELGGERNDL